ncbi:MAG: arsenic resistance protein, partial [Candidatus Kariarchaeaceae archaeon]
MSNVVKLEEKKIDKDEGLGVFEKYLALWVAICMIIGIILSQIMPTISETIDSWQISGISIPIGICLFLMMYPAMLNLKTSEIKKLTKAPKPIILTLFSNWVIAPIVGAVLASIFLPGNEQLIVAVILLSSSPCTAMVIVWGMLAEGNQEQNVITTSINTFTILFLYAPIVGILVGIQSISIDSVLLLVSALIFIGLPLILGVISKRLLVKQKGEEWFSYTFRPLVGKIGVIAILVTLVVLFS